MEDYYLIKIKTINRWIETEKKMRINKMINGNTDENQKVEFVEERYYHFNTIKGKDQLENTFY